jgi:tetratricopeptide (TPR) repeat protein
METIAGRHFAHGRLQDALVMAEKALEFYRRVLPENHPTTGALRFSVACCTCLPTHWVSGHAMGSVAVMYHELGRHHDALVLREETLEFNRRVLPEDHPERGAAIIVALDFSCELISVIAGDAMVRLAETYSCLKRHQDALALKEKVLQHYQRVLPENHPDIGVADQTSVEFVGISLYNPIWLLFLTRFAQDLAMGNLANTYLALGRPQDALALHEASLEFRRRVLPEGHPHTGSA